MKEEKKRVLLITDVAFWQVGLGSRSRILALLSTLKEHFYVDVFFLGKITSDFFESNFSEQLDITSVEDWFIPAAVEKKFSKGKLFSNPSLSGCNDTLFGNSLINFIKSREKKYDAVLIEYIRWAFLASVFPEKTLLILDTHDLMAAREWRFSVHNRKHHVSISLAEELAIFEKFHVVIAIQYEEFKFIEASLKRALPLCCPHSLSVENKISLLKANVMESKDCHNLHIGFIGSGSDANVDSLIWFLNQVWPVVKMAGLTLNIYGGVCNRVEMQPYKKEKVIFHGVVKNLKEIYNLCDFMINPILFGGGLKIKSVEAICYGKPLVSSPEGAVGIKNLEKSGILVAKKREQFIDAILLLAQSPEYRLYMSKMAFESSKQFSPAACFNDLISLIRMW